MRPGGRTARVRTQVIDATIRVLVEKGFEGLRVEDVAAASGVHKTTVYRRWPTKRDLVVDAVREFTSQAIPMPDTGSTREDFIEIVCSLAATLSSPVGQAIVRTAQAGDSAGEGVAEFGREVWRGRVRAADPVVRRAVERGDLPATDTDTLYEILCGPLHFRVLLGGRPFTRADAERHVDLVLAGLRATAGHPMPPSPPGGAGPS